MKILCYFWKLATVTRLLQNSYLVQCSLLQCSYCYSVALQCKGFILLAFTNLFECKLLKVILPLLVVPINGLLSVYAELYKSGRVPYRSVVIKKEVVQVCSHQRGVVQICISQKRGCTGLQQLLGCSTKHLLFIYCVSHVIFHL